MEVQAVNNTTTKPTRTSPQDMNGISQLTSEDFLKMLITQLENQDPTQPMTNEELLNQISMMRDLQANMELSETLKSMSEALTANLVSQQLSAAASLIGKIVTGKTKDGQEITGVVDRAFLQDGKIYVGIGDEKLELSDITKIETPSTETATTTD